METQKTQRVLIAYIFYCLLALFVAGCGGGTEVATVSVTEPADEEPPVVVDTTAVKNPIITVQLGGLVQVDGNTSLPPSATSVSYSWSFVSTPDLSTAILDDPTAAMPSFTADIAGPYRLELVETYTSNEGTPPQALTFTNRNTVLVMASADGTAIAGNLDHSGLPSDCSECHNAKNNANNGQFKSKTPNHVATSDSCQSCHTTSSFAAITFVDHQEVFGNCSECHNNKVAIGKSDQHIETTQECDACHSTDGFFFLQLDGSFDHSNISDGCSVCHTGVLAVGKNIGHIDTVGECNACHTTDAFKPAISVDHSVIDEGCVDCHGTDINPDPYPGATRKIASHPVTTADCSTCHNVKTFNLGGVFNHSVIDSVTQSCASCHDGSRDASGAIGKNGGHVNTVSDCGACHNTTLFIPAFIDHTGPDVIGNRCDSCHGVTATGKSVNHMPTTEDCNVCHTPGAFTTGTYDHAGINSNCESCHDNVITLGKLLNHIPTAQDCIVCHDITAFTPSTFDHAGISNDCMSCHDGNSAKGKSTNHLPTAEDCSTCHTGSFDSFAGTIFNHANIDQSNCALCHNGVIAIDKTVKVNHIPASQDCSTCHIDTSHSDTDNGGFTSSIFLSNVHTGIATGCEGCHNTQIATGKMSNHLPTLQDCYICHIKTAFSPASNFNHTGISKNCASCHDGNHITATSSPSGKSANHVATSQDCGSCHNTSTFTPAFVDHSGPSVVGNRCDSCHGTTAVGKNNGHIVTNSDCAVCHVPGSFKNAVFDHTGIVDNCADCHGDSPAADAITTATKKLVDHVPTTKDCSTCHNTTAFAGAKFNHTGIVNNCKSCHDGNTAIGKHIDHVPTNGECIECHQTTGFKPATFAHVGIVDNCQSCHNGSFAQGKSINHATTNQDCGVCHTTSSFKGAGFDHTGIVDDCESCHINGGQAESKAVTADHIQPLQSNSCHLCHTTASFVGGAFNHDGVDISSGCKSCHDDGTPPTATGMSTTHFVTNAECSDCHTTVRWAPISYTHKTATGRNLGNHRASLSCMSCHTQNNQNILFTFGEYAPPQDNDVYCAACHANDFERKGDHIGGENGTVAQNKNCAASGCHSVSDRNFN